MKHGRWLIILCCVPVYAEVATDGTTGAIQHLSGQMTIEQSLGTTAGNNLFHSFQTFNINNGESATFTGDSAIHNVISRVTGNQISTINGLLKSEIGTANFYFINPAGVTFGANAQIDVPAAFHLSTADHLRFSDGSQFSATDPSASILTIAEPASFGFLENSSVNQGDINFDNTTLAVKNGKTLDLVARNIESKAQHLFVSSGVAHGLGNGSWNTTVQVPGYLHLSAPAGEIRLVAITGEAQVSVQQDNLGKTPLPNNALPIENGGNIVLRDSILNTDGDGGGRVAVWAGNLEVNNRSATDNNPRFSVNNTNNTNPSSAAGIEIKAQNIHALGDARFLSIASQAGNGGSIAIDADTLTIEDGAIVYSGTDGAGKAGDINVNARYLTMDRTDVAAKMGLKSLFTGIVSHATPYSTGDSGAITINAEQLYLNKGSEISTATWGQGNAGAITVNSHDLTIDGIGVNGWAEGFFAGIASRAFAGSKGDTGSMNINTNTLSLLSGGEIVAEANGLGKTADMLINADSIIIDGENNFEAMGNSSLINGMINNPINTGIASRANSATSGDVGRIVINTGSLDVLRYGAISSSTGAQSNAAAISISATGNINLESDAKITSQADSASQGSSGTINLSSDSLNLHTNSEVSSSSFGTNRTGDIVVTTKSLSLSDYAEILLNTDSENPHAGVGDITINSDSVSLYRDAQIASINHLGTSGSININATDSLNITGYSNFLDPHTAGIRLEAVNDNRATAGAINIKTSLLDINYLGFISLTGLGNINITANDVIVDVQSSISSATAAQGTGDGGAINLKTDYLILLDGGNIFSTTANASKAANINLVSNYLKINGSNIDPLHEDSSATGVSSQTQEGSTGDAGNISIHSNEIDLLNGGIVSTISRSSGKASAINVMADVLNINGQNTQSWHTYHQDYWLVTSAPTDNTNFRVIGFGGFPAPPEGAMATRWSNLLPDYYDNSSYNTGILSNVEANSAGNAGAITVAANTVNLIDSGAITSNTAGAGNAAQIELSVKNRLTVMGHTGENAGISSAAASGSTGNAGNITLNAGAIDMVNSGVISSTTAATGNAGNININTDNLTIDGLNSSYATGVFSHALAGSTGNAGNISLVVTKQLEIANGGLLSSCTFGQGKAGNLDVQADNIKIYQQEINSNFAISSITRSFIATYNASTEPRIRPTIYLFQSNDFQPSHPFLTIEESPRAAPLASTLDLSGRPTNVGVQGIKTSLTKLANLTGIVSQSAVDSVADSGAINIKANTIALQNGGVISSTTYSAGNAGAIAIEANKFRIDGDHSSLFTGVASTADFGSRGNAGNISISSAKLGIFSGAEISASTYGTGNGGAITILSENLIIDGKDSPFYSGISATSGVENSGNGGSLMLKTNTLDILSGGKISFTTFGKGNAGDAKISADVLRIDGYNQVTGIFSSANLGSSGSVGNLEIAVSKTLSLANQAKISIKNNAHVAQNATALKTGLINISATDIEMKDSGITAESTGNGNASNININVAHSLSLDPSFISTSANLGNGGDITIHSGELIALQDSKVFTSVDQAGGNGGNILITANTLVMNNAAIQANAYAGHGGNINLSLTNLISSQNQLVKGGEKIEWQPFSHPMNVIQASSKIGISGSINVNSPQFNLSGSLSELNSAALSVPKIDHKFCQNAGIPNSSLTRGSKGGMPDDGLHYGFIPKMILHDSVKMPAQNITPAAFSNLLLLLTDDYACAPLAP